MITEKEKSFLDYMHNKDFTDAKVLYDLTHAVTNNFSVHLAEISTALADDKAAVQLALTWIAYWGVQPDYCFDGRNEYSGLVCRVIANSDYFKDVLRGNSFLTYFNKRWNPDWFIDFSKFVEKYGQNYHRTLMQTFSSLLFRILAKNSYISNTEMMYFINGQFGEDWYRTPFI